MSDPQRRARSSLRSGPTEDSIQKSIRRQLNLLPHAYFRKTYGGARSSGWPDIIGSYHGHMVCLEVKRPGGKATPLQLRELQRWEEAGAVAAVVTSFDEVRQLLDKIR